MINISTLKKGDVIINPTWGEGVIIHLGGFGKFVYADFKASGRTLYIAEEDAEHFELKQKGNKNE